MIIIKKKWERRIKYGSGKGNGKNRIWSVEDKKGENVCAIDISSVSVLADYFVIANGNSDSQVRALVENVEEKMHKAGYAAKETEGHRSGAWVLIDFGDVIVHIFDRENRPFYNLERIWSDGKDVEMNELS